MLRLTLLITALLALVAPPALAQSGEVVQFVGITVDGTSARFYEDLPTQLSRPRRVEGVERGDRIMAITFGFAVGRTGRIYRYENAAAQQPSVTPTPVRLALSGKSFSIVRTAAGVRVLGDRGFDASADLATGVVTAGPGFRLLGSGTPVSGVWALLPDGRMSGVSPQRGTLLTETAPGSGVVTEVKLRPQSRSPYAKVQFGTPIAYALRPGGTTAYLTTALPELSLTQSTLVRIDLRTGDVRGEAGPFFFRGIRALLPVGAAVSQRAIDRTPPRVSRVVTPKVVSLRDLRVNNRVKVGLRCSEACIVQAGTAIGGRTNITMSASRDTPGSVRFGLFGLRGRAYDLMKARVGRTALFRIRVQDWRHNETTIERTFRLTR